MRQREEAAGLEPGRHEEVARALGRRLGHDRRLDVHEAGGLHLLPDDRDHPRAQPHVALHPLAAQVDPPVADPERLVDAFLVELERERSRAREDLEPVDLDLDLARRQVRVHGVGRAPDDLTLGLQDELVSNLVRRPHCVRSPLGIDHELADARLVAQVDEDETAVVAPAGRPARERHAPPDVLGAHLAAAQVAPAHPVNLSRSSPTGTVVSGSPRRRIEARSPSTTTIVSAPSRWACVSWPLSERPA